MLYYKACSSHSDEYLAGIIKLHWKAIDDLTLLRNIVIFKNPPFPSKPQHFWKCSLRFQSLTANLRQNLDHVRYICASQIFSNRLSYKNTQASLSRGWFWSLVSLCRSLFWCRIPLNLSTHIELIWSHISSDHLISCLFLADSFPCGSSSLLPVCLVAEVSIVSELSTSWTFAQFIYATSKA